VFSSNRRKAWQAWQISQSYNKTPSEYYGIEGAVGLCFDNGIFLFAQWVEGEMQEAEARAQNEMFARSNRARAFARCMGDDMATSTAGYQDPFAGGSGLSDDNPHVKRRRRKPFAEEEPGDEILWDEKALAGGG